VSNFSLKNKLINNEQKLSGFEKRQKDKDKKKKKKKKMFQ